MSTCYCPSCAAKLEYTGLKPAKCTKCGKPLSTALKLNLEKIDSAIAKVEVNSPQAPSRPFSAQSKRAYRTPVNEDDYDTNQVEDLKQQILASGGLSIRTDVTEDRPFTFGDLVRNPNLAR
jgi:hypothetical protein